ncbi:GD11955 [Drosophila simulans]|uniref:GD11955 n=1 Tax=Drosophila simulans TaxID=7240 RepID=B4NTK8_DROSI|nr:GD11955 [Drosophila simulans]
MEVFTVDELREECIEVEQSSGRRERASYGQQRRMWVNVVKVHDEHGEQQVLEKRSAPDPLFLLSLWTTGHSVTEEPRMRGKRPAGQFESGRDSPRHECCEVIVEKELKHQMSGMRLVSGKVQEARDRFKIRKYKRRKVVVAVTRIKCGDPKSFADVTILDGLAPTVVGGIVPKLVKEAVEVHVRQMEHYADQEEMDEAKEEPESWNLSAGEREAL